MKKTPDIIHEEGAPGTRYLNYGYCGVSSSADDDQYNVEDLKFASDTKIATYTKGQKIWAYSYIAEQWFECVVTAPPGNYVVQVYSEGYADFSETGSGAFSASLTRLDKPADIFEYIGP